MTAADHDLEWNDRLQDWLDGDLAADERTAVEAHVGACDACKEQLALLRTLDASLVAALPRLALDESFDARLFERISSVDEARRAADRARVRQELEADLTKLARDWRHTLAIVIPSVLAGIALAFGLAAYFDTAEWAQTLTARGAGEIGAINATHLHLLLTSAIGAATGYVIARWLTPSASLRF
ncbi:MAG: hypothetical protein GX535_13065 [Xanthomonadaceae bacterium]|nr:hypothetical protein [Xanthomonadaceae bacterium]